MIHDTDRRVTRASRSRRAATVLGTSAGYTALFFVVSLAILGEDLTTALWQSLFCFVAITVLTVMVALFRPGGQPRSRRGEDSDPRPSRPRCSPVRVVTSILCAEMNSRA